MQDRKMGSVVIHGKLHELWSRVEEHELGKMNNASPNLWVKRIVGDSFEWTPWLDQGSNRYSFDIHLTQGNRIKCKWNDVDIRGTGICTITCNLHPVAEFGFNDLGYALAKSQQLVMELQEFGGVDLTNPREVIGKKIWYDDQPAIVQRWCEHDLWVVPDTKHIAEFDVSKPWHDEYMTEAREEWKEGVRVELLDRKIWWWRDE